MHSLLHSVNGCALPTHLLSAAAAAAAAAAGPPVWAGGGTAVPPGRRQQGRWLTERRKRVLFQGIVASYTNRFAKPGDVFVHVLSRLTYFGWIFGHKCPHLELKCTGCARKRSKKNTINDVI